MSIVLWYQTLSHSRLQSLQTTTEYDWVESYYAWSGSRISVGWIMLVWRGFSGPILAPSGVSFPPGYGFLGQKDVAYGGIGRSVIHVRMCDNGTRKTRDSCGVGASSTARDVHPRFKRLPISIFSSIGASGVTPLSPLARENAPSYLLISRSNGCPSCPLLLFREPRHTPVVKSSLVPKNDFHIPSPYTLVEHPPVLQLQQGCPKNTRKNPPTKTSSRRMRLVLTASSIVG